VNLVHKARKFAFIAHAGQEYGDVSYTYHLDNVYRLVLRYSENAQVLAWLHDTLENTKKTYSDILYEFGPEMARMVELITDEKGKNRYIRKLNTNLKLASCPKEYYDVLIVKAADRLSNMQESLMRCNTNLMKMYYNEYDSFKIAVYRPNLCDDLWRSLDIIYKEICPFDDYYFLKKIIGD